MTAPTPLRPLPGRLGACPAGHGPLEPDAIHVAGWRSLFRGRCRACGHVYLQDLPAGHGLLAPCSLDLASGETHGPARFADPLRAYYEQPDAGAVEITVDRRRAAQGPAVLLACLDVDCDRALGKLLNAGRHRDERCIALVSRALHALVPDHVDEAWVVQASFARLRSWLLELDGWVAERLDELSDGVRLSPAEPYPPPSTYRLAEHLAAITPARRGEPSIVLSLRGDPAWGRTGPAQRRNVARFAGRVRARFPRAQFTAVGIGASELGELVEDRRAAAPDARREREWLEALAGADLVLEAGGDDAAAPAGLGAATVTLLPRGRYAGASDTVVTQSDPRAALRAHRTLYGDEHLGDVDGARAGAVAALLLADGAAGPAPPEAAVEPGVVARVAPVVRARVQRARSIARTACVLGRRELSRVRARRLPAPPLVLSDARGARFELLDRAEVAAFLEHRGHFEAAELDLLVRYLQAGDAALDIGANLGHFSATIGRAVGAAGTVHAFEPLAANRARLRRTLELNGLGSRVHVEPAAVTARPGEVEIVDYGEGFGSWATTKPAEHDLRGERPDVGTTVVVPAITLDEYCARHAIDHVAALKIDVEGAELDVLDGAEGFLAAGGADLLIVECSDTTLLPAGRASWELADRLGRGALRTYALAGGRLTPHRHAGWTEFSNVIALSPAGRARLGL